MHHNILLYTLLLFLSIPLFAQQYQRTDNIPVNNLAGNIYGAAWAGGMHSPQFSATDLNNDGNKDLVVFDREDASFTVLVNEGTEGNIQYRFDPALSAPFDSCDCFNWALMRDYNNDGLDDIFCSPQSDNVQIFKQTRPTPDSIVFEREIELLQTEIETSGEKRQLFLFSGKIDIPAIIDVDRDGDLDFLTFNVIEQMEWHRNYAVEDVNRKDTLILRREDRCWGNFREDEVDNTPILGDTTGEGCELREIDLEAYATRSKHAGSTILLLDLDADSVYDALIGDRNFTDVYALFNGGSPEFANMDSVETFYPQQGFPIELFQFPAPFYIDVNNDGKRDLIVSPNGSVVEDKNSILLYENEGLDNAPIFDFPQKGFLQTDQIEAGTQSHPVFIDVNGDGLQDLIVCNLFARFNESGVEFTLPLSLYFENIGTATNPAFQLISEDILQLRSNFSELEGGSPAAGDLDGDGNEDIILGSADGTLILFKNNGPQNGIVSFSLDRNFLMDINGGIDSAPTLFDVDQDNDLDLFIGNEKGVIAYFQNTGSPTEADFTLISDNWGGLKINDEFGSELSNGHARPVFSDIDKDGETELLVGSVQGVIEVYDNIENVLATPNVDTLRFVGNLNDIDVGTNAAPALAQLDETTFPTLIVGNTRGGLMLFNSSDNDSTTVSNSPLEKPNAARVKVFPNPAHQIIHLSFSPSASSQPKSIRLLNALGQTIDTWTTTQRIQPLDVSGIPNGMYILKVQVDGDQYITRILKE